MLYILFELVLLCLIVKNASGFIAEHEITPEMLPGWTGALPSRMYSGYIPTGNISGVPGFIHYWFIESQRDPANDPVVYWTNGKCIY